MSNKYNDPSGRVEQYSMEYLRKLRKEDPEEMLRLWRAGHFDDAAAEENAKKLADKKFWTNKGTNGRDTRKWAEGRGVNLDDEDPSF